MQPTRIEKYDILDEIGHGGMATVYRARDTRLDRPVALKVMHPHLRGAKEARERFAREAVTVARLKHPSILEIYDYSGEESDASYIATELLTGPTLKEFAEKHPSIPPEIVACIGLQLARALAAAHAEGIVHRDVKPENVLLHEGREVKLTDFGIAQLVDMQSMTSTGQLLGSPGHMAPEQVEGKDIDARSDMFSLGTVLYFLATGELPFRGRNPHQILKQIVEGRFADPLQIRGEIGGRLRGILMRCLETDPARRYQGADALAEDLAGFLQEMGIESPKETLAAYLADPEVFACALRARVIERLTELGEAAQRRHSVPAALDYFNRVLAMDEGNPRVLAAVRRMGRRSASRRLAVAVLAVVALVAAGTLVVRTREPPPPPASAQPPVASAPAVSRVASPAPASATPPMVPARVEPARTEAPDPDRDRPRSAVPRTVVFQPVPVNVSIGIDGAPPKPFGPSFREVELPPGQHRFLFVGAHDCCVDRELVATVPAGPGTTTVAHRLEFRPAGLYVVSDVPANVVVDGGKISGRSRSVINVVGLESMVELHRIRVAAPGRADHDAEVQLTAGKVTTVEVSLRPAPE
jgi:serine/threonine-protein kinase